jgi:uncharacterized protein
MQESEPFAPSKPFAPNGYCCPSVGITECGGRGQGVFARRLIRTDEVIVAFGGTVYSEAMLMGLAPNQARYNLQIDEELFMVSDRPGPADLVNHSCDPNAGLRGQVVLVAMRPIPKGEEITYDYAMSDGSSYDEFECCCGARGCRGRVTGDDWRRPELWRRYAGYFAPYLQLRIETQQQRRRVRRTG